jgi:hypothetical protein
MYLNSIDFYCQPVQVSSVIEGASIPPAISIDEDEMPKKIAPADNSSNMKNMNKGTSGTNKQYDQNQGNRGRQMAETKPPAAPVNQPGNK